MYCKKLRTQRNSAFWSAREDSSTSPSWGVSAQADVPHLKHAAVSLQTPIYSFHLFVDFLCSPSRLRMPGALIALFVALLSLSLWAATEGCISPQRRCAKWSCAVGGAACLEKRSLTKSLTADFTEGDFTALAKLARVFACDLCLFFTGLEVGEGSEQSNGMLRRRLKDEGTYLRSPRGLNMHKSRYRS